MTGISTLKPLKNTVYSQFATHVPLHNIRVPVEFIIELFSFLDVPTLLNCSLISKRWRELVDNALIWKQKAGQHGLSIEMKIICWKTVLVRRQRFSPGNIHLKKVIRISGQFAIVRYIPPVFYYKEKDSNKIRVYNADTKKFSKVRSTNKIEKFEVYKNSLITLTGVTTLSSFTLDKRSTIFSESSFHNIKHFKIVKDELVVLEESRVYFKNLLTNEMTRIEIESSINSKINSNIIVLIGFEDFHFILISSKKIIHQNKAEIIKNYEDYQVFLSGNYFFIHFFSSNQKLVKVFEIKEECLITLGSIILQSKINLISICNGKYFNLNGQCIFFACQNGVIFLFHASTLTKIYEVDTETFLPIRNLEFKNYFLFVSFKEIDIQSAILIIDMVSNKKINPLLFLEKEELLDFKFYNNALVGIVYDKNRDSSKSFICEFKNKKSKPSLSSCAIL